MHYALGTSYFFRLIDQPDGVVRATWNDFREETAVGVVLFELNRHALVGRLPKSTVDALVARADDAFQVVWMNSMVRTDRTARLAYGEGLSMAEALVLMAAPETEATRLYTGDRDLASLDGFESLDIIEGGEPVSKQKWKGYKGPCTPPSVLPCIADTLYCLLHAP